MSQDAGAVIGINLGHSYGSIACINQHGRADVIANEDGERQLATRIAFNADQVYIGNQATPQLVRNASNVIDRFVNLLGRSYSELTDAEKARSSSPVVDHAGQPAFRVEIDGKPTTLTAHDAAVRFLRSLFLTAKEFLSGVPIAGAVLVTPLHFSAKQQQALRAAASDAGLVVLQLLAAPAAALVGYQLTSPGELGELPPNPDAAVAGAGIDEARAYAHGGKELDRVVAVVDVGGTSTSATVVAARAGLYSVLSHAHDAALGGAQLDDALVAHFAREFTKKTKVGIDAGNARAWAKLRNEAEVTKRALSASASAQCSVESLADGVDFSGAVNRVRFDLLAAPVYEKVAALVRRAVQDAKLDVAQVDEVVLAGGSARLTGLADRIASVFPEPLPARITSAVDSDQLLARGAAVQAQLLATTPADAPERTHVLQLPAQPAAEVGSLRVPVTSRPLGLVAAAPVSNGASSTGSGGPSGGGAFVELLAAQTPLPARRRYRLGVAAGAKEVLLAVAEGTAKVHVAKAEPSRGKDDLDDEDEDEDEEPEETRTAYVEPDAKRLAELVVALPGGGAKAAVEVEVRADASGAVVVTAGAAGSDASTWQRVSLPAP